MDEKALKDLAIFTLKTVEIQNHGPWDGHKGEPLVGRDEAANLAGASLKLQPFLRLLAWWPDDARQAAEAILTPSEQNQIRQDAAKIGAQQQTIHEQANKAGRGR